MVSVTNLGSSITTDQPQRIHATHLGGLRAKHMIGTSIKIAIMLCVERKREREREGKKKNEIHHSTKTVISVLSSYPKIRFNN